MTYNGSKLKGSNQIFFAGAASFWTHFRRHRAVFERLCGVGGVERVHAPRESAYFARWRMGGFIVETSVRVGRGLNLARIPIIGRQMSTFIALAPLLKNKGINLDFAGQNAYEKQQNSASFVRPGRPSRCGNSQ